MVRCTWDRAEVQAAEQTAHPSAVRAGGRVLSSNGCTQIDEEPEREALDAVMAGPWMLEQERIPLSDAERAIRTAFA